MRLENHNIWFKVTHSVSDKRNRDLHFKINSQHILIYPTLAILKITTMEWKRKHPSLWSMQIWLCLPPLPIATASLMSYSRVGSRKTFTRWYQSANKTHKKASTGLSLSTNAIPPPRNVKHWTKHGLNLWCIKICLCLQRNSEDTLHAPNPPKLGGVHKPRGFVL